MSDIYYPSPASNFQLEATSPTRGEVNLYPIPTRGEVNLYPIPTRGEVILYPKRGDNENT